MKVWTMADRDLGSSDQRLADSWLRSSSLGFPVWGLGLLEFGFRVLFKVRWDFDSLRPACSSGLHNSAKTNIPDLQPGLGFRA